MGLFGQSKETKQANKEYTNIGKRAAEMEGTFSDRSGQDYGRYSGFIDPMQGAWKGQFFDAAGNYVNPYATMSEGMGGYAAPQYNTAEYQGNLDFYKMLRDKGWHPDDAAAAAGFGKFEAAAKGGLQGLLGADEYGRIKSAGLVNFMPGFEAGALRAGRINSLGAGRMGGNLRQLMQQQVAGNTAFMGDLAKQSAQATQWGAGKANEYANQTTGNRLQGASGVTSMADKLNEYAAKQAAGHNAGIGNAIDLARMGFGDMWKYGMQGAELTGANSQGWAGMGQQSLGQRLAANQGYANYNPNKSFLDKMQQVANIGGGIAGAITGMGGIGSTISGVAGGLLKKKKNPGYRSPDAGDEAYT